MLVSVKSTHTKIPSQETTFGHIIESVFGGIVRKGIFRIQVVELELNNAKAV
jgi:hypothetical protein